MQEIDWYRMLNIKTKGYLPQEEVSDEIIKEKFSTIEQEIKMKVEEIKKEKGSHFDTKKLEESLQIIRIAYDKLATENSREKYEAKYLKQRALEYSLSSIIQKLEDENDKKKIVRENFNKGNRAAEVKENNNNYDVVYDDDDLMILENKQIKFLNGYIVEDFINEYTLLINSTEESISIGYGFYSKIDKDKIKEKAYRKNVLKCVKNAVKENKNYIGTIKELDGVYYQVIDDGEKDAIVQSNIINKTKKEKTEKQKENGVEI